MRLVTTQSIGRSIRNRPACHIFCRAASTISASSVLAAITPQLRSSGSGPAGCLVRKLQSGVVMRKTLYMYALLASSLVSCRETTGLIETAPETSEQLAVSVQDRTPNPGEPIPTVRISGGTGNVTIEVTRPGMCATVVVAGISRAPGDLAVVARVSSDPAALCAGPIFTHVVDYKGTITLLSAGAYRVRVFDAAWPDSPRLIGSATVSVSAPAS